MSTESMLMPSKSIRFISATMCGSMFAEGRGDYTPILLSDIPRLFHSGQLPLDVALIQVTPPDKRGKVSLGVSVDIVRSAAENASLVIAQVNPQMPWTRGNSLLDIYDLDILVPADMPILERHEPEPQEEIKKIAELAAALVPNGATLEFGLGRVPGHGRITQAVLSCLKDKKDLGIHTELITDQIIELIEAGVVTGARKSLDRGKIVASFCMGSRKLYDFIDDNPLSSFRPTEYVNDSNVIGRQNMMVAINMALEVDLTGQICSDSREWFVLLRHRRAGGLQPRRRPLRERPADDAFALPDGGRQVRESSRGSAPAPGVVITRGTVHYVVSEYGVAYLHGKSVQERTLALISIAHPDHREQLLREAIEAKFVRAEFAEVEGKFVVASRENMKTHAACSTTARQITSGRCIPPMSRACAIWSTICPRRRFITGS